MPLQNTIYSPSTPPKTATAKCNQNKLILTMPLVMMRLFSSPFGAYFLRVTETLSFANVMTEEVSK